MESVLSVKYIFELVCLIVSFFTFVKLTSSDVYISNHRILPTIAGIIIIYDFYLCFIPLVKSTDTADFLHTLCDVCALVAIFMMFFFFLFMKNPKHISHIIIVANAVMMGICAYDIWSFCTNHPKPVNADIVGVVFVAFSCLLVHLGSKTKKYFDRTDKIVLRYMFVAFAIAVIAFVAHDFIPWAGVIRPAAFLIDCLIFYYLALSNRIEDTATILKSTLFDRMEYPTALVNSDFYIVDANVKAQEVFSDEIGNINFAFSDGSSKGKFLLGENLVTNNRNDAEFYVGDAWYSVHYQPVEEKGAVKGYIFSAFDITEQHIDAANARRETAKKSQFLAQMSHELRSPLHAIQGISDVLVTKKDISSKNKNLISHIKRASDNLLELVNAILDYSKLEAGKFEFSERIYDINEMFEEIAYATILNLQSKPVDFNLAITTDYPKYIYGDAIRVREIFQNMLSNAVKFTDKGHIHAEVSFTEESGRWRIDFSVADTGQGMTPQQIDEVFKEYVSSADGRQIEGTGLGLAIIKQLISKLDGSVSAKSDGMTGSVFLGHFYQKSNDSEILPEKVFNKRTLMNNNNQGIHGLVDKVDFVYPRANVLVADDMRINLEIMQQFLQPWECEITTVPDGESAVRAARERHFDLILLDQMMMPVSGPEACLTIKEFCNVPIVLVTANSEDNARAIVREYGFDDFLAKPIVGVRLKEIVEGYLPKDLAEPNSGDTVVSIIKRNRQNESIYHKTLEAFVREMQPLLLMLPTYRKDDREMFKVKVHGIAGVSKQIGRDTFADQARIMEMAAKSESWGYVDEHLDEFLSSLCNVVEDATNELSHFAPDVDFEEVSEGGKIINIDDVIGKLYKSFDEYDLSAIEEGLEDLNKADKDEGLSTLFEKLKEAYDNLEYEDGSELLSEYLNSAS